MAKIIKDPLAQAESSKVAPRADLNLQVGMKTFGTRHYMDLKTRNISASGMLACLSDDKDVASFRDQTLLELVFYPDGHYIESEVKLTAVVARTSASADKQRPKREFGVRFVDVPDALEQAIKRSLRR